MDQTVMSGRLLLLREEGGGMPITFTVARSATIMRKR